MKKIYFRGRIERVMENRRKPKDGAEKDITES